MARIKGVDIPNDKQVETSLTYIYGSKNIERLNTKLIPYV